MCLTCHQPCCSICQGAPCLSLSTQAGPWALRLIQIIPCAHGTLSFTKQFLPLPLLNVVGWGESEASWAQLCPSVGLSFLICDYPTSTLYTHANLWWKHRYHEQEINIPGLATMCCKCLTYLDKYTVHKNNTESLLKCRFSGPALTELEFQF